MSNIPNQQIDRRQFLGIKSQKVIRFFACLALFAAVSGVAAKADIPPFTAKGIVINETYRPLNTNYLVRKEGGVLFSYSNGIWQVQFILQHVFYPNSITTKEEMGTVIDCKRIPGGIRQIITFPSRTNSTTFNGVPVRPSAVATIERFPSPLQKGLFLPWLSLCPNPELPLISSNRIHFIFMTQLLDNPKNEGGFSASYIQPQAAFLSELDVSNNGTFFSSDGSNVEYGEPYKDGFTEFSYRVLATTNCNGIVFPLHTVLYGFEPLPNGKSRDDIYPMMITRFDIHQIDVGAHNLELIPTPKVLVALDSRPTGLNNHVTVNYDVANDQWSSPTNKRIQQLAKIFRHRASNNIQEHDKHGRNRIVIFFVFALITLMPLTAWILQLKKTNKNNK